MKKSGTTLLRYDDRHAATLDAYFDEFAALWTRDIYDRTVFDLWLHVVDHAARVARAVRLDQPGGVIDDLADTAVWVFSFVAQCAKSTNPLDAHFKFDTSLSDVIWDKYPGTCPSCFDTWILRMAGSQLGSGSATEQFAAGLEAARDAVARRADQYETPTECTCLARALEEEADRTARDELRGELDDLRRLYANLLRTSKKKFASIDELETMISLIFRQSQRVFSLQTLAFHLLEEIGDVTQAIKDCYTYDEAREPFTPARHAQRRKALQEQTADVVSWIFAISLKVQAIYHKDADQYFRLVDGRRRDDSPRSRELRLADVIWAKYGMAAGSDAIWDTLRCPGCGGAPCVCPRDLKITWVSEASLPASAEEGEMSEGTKPAMASSTESLPRSAREAEVGAQVVVQVTVDQSHNKTQRTSHDMSETNINTGIAGSVGSQSSGTIHNAQQVWSSSGEGAIDLPKLAGQLSTLRAELKLLPNLTPEQDIQASEIARAEISAREGNGPATIEHLSKAGKWTWDLATKIGATLAATALAVALGIK